MKKISHNRLIELLDFNRETGIFTRKLTVHGRWKIGSISGSRHSKDGYIEVWADGKRYYAHILAWFHGRVSINF